MAKWIVVVSLAVVLLSTNFAIIQKEQHLSNGRSVFLRLAPIDPRSLMQGDYMVLSFEVADAIYTSLPKQAENRRWRHDVATGDGFVIVNLDLHHVAQFHAIYHQQTLQENQIRLRYRVRNGAVQFATNAFFFQEGTGASYETAEYGEFRVDQRGELLLVAMYDSQLNPLEP